MAAWDLSSHACIITRFFFSFFSLLREHLAETNGPKNELRSAGQEEVGRRRNDDVLALALLYFRALGNGQLLLFFSFREEYGPC